MAGTGIPLAIIPGGSGNGLARDLGIPLDRQPQAFTIAATGATRAIDAGDLHGSLFFNVAGIGFDARIADRLAEPGARRGLVGYVLATVSELRSYEPGAYSIHNAFDVDGKALIADIIDRPALFIALANSRQYGSGAQIAPSALLDDGMIEIVVVEPQSAFSILRQVPAFFRGTLREGPGLLMRSAASMEISCAHPIRFHVDGEPRDGPESHPFADPARRPVGQGKSLILKGFPRSPEQSLRRIYATRLCALGQDSRPMLPSTRACDTGEDAPLFDRRDRRRAGKCAKSATAKSCEQVHYQDWHRVERARRSIAIELDALRRQGLVGSPELSYVTTSAGLSVSMKR